MLISGDTVYTDFDLQIKKFLLDLKIFQSFRFLLGTSVFNDIVSISGSNNEYHCIFCKSKN